MSHVLLCAPQGTERGKSLTNWRPWRYRPTGLWGRYPASSGARGCYNTLGLWDGPGGNRTHNTWFGKHVSLPFGLRGRSFRTRDRSLRSRGVDDEVKAFLENIQHMTVDNWADLVTEAKTLLSAVGGGGGPSRVVVARELADNILKLYTKNKHPYITTSSDVLAHSSSKKPTKGRNH